MSTKAQIIALIQGFLSGNPSKTTWEEHEDILFDEPHSILENIYPTVLNEGDIGGGSLTITTNNSDFKFNAKFSKTGRKVSVDGYAIPQNTVNSPDYIFEITGSEYQHSNIYNTTSVTNTGDIIRLELSGNKLYIKDVAGSGETIYFNFSYNVTN